MRRIEMVAKPSGVEAVEAYLQAVPEPARSALEDLRKAIKAAAPHAVEAMSYGAPGFRQDGALVCYAAFKTHCSFFPMSAALMDTLGDELKGLRTSKGTIQFAPDQPLGEALVRRIVAARIAENAARAKKPRKGSPTSS